MTIQSKDMETAAAFSNSWNNLPVGSVYTLPQVRDWFEPLDLAGLEGLRVLELGCGGGNLMVHILGFKPTIQELVGVELGDSIQAARRNLAALGHGNWRLVQDDLCSFRDPSGFDVVYCIGVLHHLKDPRQGFEAVLKNVTEGGAFHCWVYGHEGSLVIRLLVEPLRRISHRLPWWFTKYGLSTPLAALYFIYAKALSLLPQGWGGKLPLGEYSLWIAQRGFDFFRHVAFDQLVTPRTIFFKKREIESWLAADERIDQQTTYIISRNGNSWKFGGRLKGR